jgi:hypothetical protein
MAAPTYPTSSDVTGGQSTLASHYNTLRADALRAGATAANAVNMGQLLEGYSKNVQLEYLASNKVRVPYSASAIPALMVYGYMLRLSANADLGEAPSGAAATYYVFANRSTASTEFTLSVNTSPTPAEDQRCIGEFYWTGTAVRQGSIKSYEVPSTSDILAGVDAQKSGSPAVGDVYIATDTYTVYFCFVAGFWVGTRMGFFNDLTDGFYINGGTTSTREFNVSGGDLAFINDSAGVVVKMGKSTLMTYGLCLDQGSSDNEILAMQSSDIAHGMTDLADTDTYATAKKYSATAGGLEFSGFSEITCGLNLRGLHTTDSTTKTTGGTAAVMIDGVLKSGTGRTDLGANANILAVRNNATTRFILDADGDSHQDVGTAWTNFDAFDDAALLTDLSLAVSQAGDPIRDGFGEFLKYNRAALERLRLVTFNEDGHHFVNMSKLAMLLTGAVRQQAQALQLQAGALQVQKGKIERLEFLVDRCERLLTCRLESARLGKNEQGWTGSPG